MPPQTQKRRRRTTNGNGDDDDDATASIRRRRQSRPDDGQETRDEDADERDESDADADADAGKQGAEDQLVKKLVRYALACEYARVPVKRDAIREKILTGNPRAFKRVFDATQLHLRHVFGMELKELPVREKRTLKDKQKAAASKAASGSAAAQAASSRQYILISVLPSQFQSLPAAVGPSRAPSAADEAAYVGFYTLVVSLIVLSGGELTDGRLRRHLHRLNAATNLPMDRTDNVLARLVRQGYLDKVVERSDGPDEDSVSWCVGTRARVELPPHSIAAFIREVWGDELPEDFDKRLHKSLGLGPAPGATTEA